MAIVVWRNICTYGFIVFSLLVSGFVIRSLRLACMTIARDGSTEKNS
jgi:hypothetical protein